ncbi:MAG: DUF1501 domain-containing protein [Planctomycetia bacterium]|nr:DUF1501 domain-containing protein [Planctomycetia bacterium]
MLDVGSFASRSCAGLSRRAFLQMSASASLAFGLPQPAVARPSAVPMRAKSVLFVWLWGAPSHLDTFDPKPDAPLDIRGPFAPIATRTPGLRFSELLPRLADSSRLFSVIQSHKTFSSGHPDAGTWGLTGFAEGPGPLQPNFGVIVGKHRGSSAKLPPFVALGRGVPCDVVRPIEGFGGGSLGKTFDPFMVACSPQGEAEIPSLTLLSELTPHRLQDRHSLLRSLDHARREVDDLAGGQWARMHDRAYDLLTQPAAREALDLSRETQQTREAYGQTSFGQSCLMARRLVEAGVPYIQLNWSQYVEAMTPNCDFGWDTHIYNFELLQDRHCPIFDRAFSALLHDLDVRGLLDTTLVVAMGEFGRSPRITSRAARDHWPRCYSSLWAGAGLRGGRVIGASDKHGEDPATEPVTPLMVGTTIAELAGIDTQARAEMKVLDGGTVIHELL